MARRHWTIGLLPATEEEIISVPTNGYAVVNAIWIANITGSDRTVTIKHIPQGQATADGFCLMKGVTVSANTTTIIARDEPIFMTEGSKLTALSDSASAIAFTVYGDANSPIVREESEDG